MLCLFHIYLCLVVGQPNSAECVNSLMETAMEFQDCTAAIACLSSYKIICVSLLTRLLLQLLFHPSVLIRRKYGYTRTRKLAVNQSWRPASLMQLGGLGGCRAAALRLRQKLLNQY
jgi:hypothetical protein